MLETVLIEVAVLTELAILCFAPYFASRGARNWVGAVSRGAVANVCVTVVEVLVLTRVLGGAGEQWLLIPLALGCWIFGGLIGLVMHLLRTRFSLKV